jgi:hypothetical protein
MSLAPLAGGLLLVAGCAASTSLQSSWKDPSAKPIAPASRFLAVAFTKHEQVRWAAEDALVRQIGGDRAKASYALLTKADLKDAAGAKAKVAKAGYDYAVTLRLVSNEQELTFRPGASPGVYASRYGEFWGYYDYGWAGSQAGQVNSERTVQIELLLYSLAEEKLVWGAVSQSMNPSDEASLVREIAAVAGTDLRSKGLVGK